MDVLQLQETQRLRRVHELYTALYERALRAVNEHMRRGHEACLFPLRCSGFGAKVAPEDVGELVASTLRDRHGFRAAYVPPTQESPPLVAASWTRAQMFRSRRHAYKEVYRRCDAALRAYLESDVYRATKRRAFYFAIPRAVEGAAGYDVGVAARFVVAVCRREGFDATRVGSPLGAGVVIAWDRVSVRI